MCVRQRNRLLSRKITNSPLSPVFFFFNDTATTEIYTLSLHDALPISLSPRPDWQFDGGLGERKLLELLGAASLKAWEADRKSTRLNSSHLVISYAVFCLKKKKKRHIRFDNHNT